MLVVGVMSIRCWWNRRSDFLSASFTNSNVLSRNTIRDRVKVNKDRYVLRVLVNYVDSDTVVAVMYDAVGWMLGGVASTQTNE